MKQGDIISVAASSVKPVNITNDWLKPGSLIMFTGRCNIDEEYFSSAKIYWDNAKMHEVYYGEHMELPEDKRFINGIGVQVYRMMHEGKLPPCLRPPAWAMWSAAPARAVSLTMSASASSPAVCLFGTLAGPMRSTKTPRRWGWAPPSSCGILPT